ncbi:hypothetical protein J437_LFUL015052 [Ladona fulva]|uniref:Complex 1 LYR protein domain-containing protein n=1 Tax=Ladona fulva TaxID=123851 RepID=A0A8K0K9A1_LADFU|nr:hypothetical protein J437_LFUL015052 [Ladona fulva]
MCSKRNILNLYKRLLRESERFESYNFRQVPVSINYAIRRIKDSFKENKTLNDQEQIQKEIQYALKNLDIIKRQAAIGSMYNAGKLVIEK